MLDFLRLNKRKIIMRKYLCKNSGCLLALLISQVRNIIQCFQKLLYVNITNFESKGVYAVDKNVYWNLLLPILHDSLNNLISFILPSKMYCIKLTIQVQKK